MWGIFDGYIRPRTREAFDGFLGDPDLADLHALRENGTVRYIWWTFERIEDLRPVLNPG